MQELKLNIEMKDNESGNDKERIRELERKISNLLT